MGQILTEPDQPSGQLAFALGAPGSQRRFDEVQRSDEADANRRYACLRGNALSLVTNEVVGDPQASQLLRNAAGALATRRLLAGQHDALDLVVAKLNLPALVVERDDLGCGVALGGKQRRQQLRRREAMAPLAPVLDSSMYEFSPFHDGAASVRAKVGLDKLLGDNSVNGKRGAAQVIGDHIRHPGSEHEWLMVAEARQFKRWGVSMKTIQEGRTLTGAAIGKRFRHGSTGSNMMHRELRAMIRSSNSYGEFLEKLNQWADRELVPSHSARWPNAARLGRYSLPDSLQVRGR